MSRKQPGCPVQLRWTVVIDKLLTLVIQEVVDASVNLDELANWGGNSKEERLKTQDRLVWHFFAPNFDDWPNVSVYACACIHTYTPGFVQLTREIKIYQTHHFSNGNGHQIAVNIDEAKPARSGRSGRSGRSAAPAEAAHWPLGAW